MDTWTLWARTAPERAARISSNTQYGVWIRTVHCPHVHVAPRRAAKAAALVVAPGYYIYIIYIYIHIYIYIYI